MYSHTDSSSFGNFSSGVQVQLATFGTTDSYLVSDQGQNFFMTKYMRTIPFAISTMAQEFTGASFGGSSSLKLNNETTGDLAYFMYLVVDLPAIKAIPKQDFVPEGMDGYSYIDYDNQRKYAGPNYGPLRQAPSDDVYFENIGECLVGDQYDPYTTFKIGKKYWNKQEYGGDYDSVVSMANCESTYEFMEGKPFAHWTNAVGQAVVKEIEIYIGTKNAKQKLCSEFLFAWEELTGKAGKRLEEMIGKRKTKAQLLHDAQTNQRFYVPLPWWFTMPGLSLCSSKLKQGTIQIVAKWERLNKLIIASDGTDVVKPGEREKFSLLSNSDLSARLETSFVYLTGKIKQDLVSAPSIKQLGIEIQQSKMSSRTKEYSVPLKFKGQVKELIWMVRRMSNYDRNRLFDFSGIDNRDPIVTCSLELDGTTRFAGKEGRYYRLVTPYQHHSNIPEYFVYCESFALFPEESIPTGYLNCDPLKTATFNVVLQEGLQEEFTELLIFAPTWKYIVYENGDARFENFTTNKN